jgi:hypothetical protein
MKTQAAANTAKYFSEDVFGNFISAVSFFNERPAKEKTPRETDC